MLQSIGPKFCETILEFVQLEPTRIKQILDEIEAVETSKAQSHTGPTNSTEKIEDETAAGGLLSVDGNIGVLGVIKDEDSCQDSDFSGDEALPTGDAQLEKDKPFEKGQQQPKKTDKPDK
jgi:hypothetical protein